jgi:ribosomal protein S18 acetylase RimI-like enzyme
VEVREVRSEEHAAAGRVTVEGYRGFYGEALGSYAEVLDDVAARSKEAVVLVAIEDGTILGTATYVDDASSGYAEGQRPDEASIRMLSVAPGHQRRGAGKTLSLACVDRARAAGKRAVILHADEANETSRRMYERLGFRRDASRDYRPDDATVLVCYVLEL